MQPSDTGKKLMLWEPRLLIQRDLCNLRIQKGRMGLHSIG
uniref:Uncharacterized protein n=1 Tax=Anguilla anguilla TaxID=7936 RepID=A0A0E9VZE5_ANGAN